MRARSSLSPGGTRQNPLDVGAHAEGYNTAPRWTNFGGWFETFSNQIKYDLPDNLLIQAEKLLNSLDLEDQLLLVEFMRGMVLNGIPMFDFELQLAQWGEDTDHRIFEKINRTGKSLLEELSLANTAV